jgi:uncharacterized membrane protein YgcG
LGGRSACGRHRPRNFKLTAAANTATSERQAILSAQLPNGTNVEAPVRQVRAPPPAPVVCPTVNLSREGEQVGANRVTNFVEVEAPESECSWDVASEDSWIAVMAATRKGNGQVDYEVQPHQGTISRRGTIKIGNKVLDVIQAQVGSAQPSDSGGGGDSGGDGSGSGSGSGGDAGG